MEQSMHGRPRQLTIDAGLLWPEKIDISKPYFVPSSEAATFRKSVSDHGLVLNRSGKLGLNNPGKLRLLNVCLDRSELLDDSVKRCIADCFTQVHQCRSYRNAIIHHHICGHEKGIGS
jgi:hypothetical protein